MALNCLNTGTLSCRPGLDQLEHWHIQLPFGLAES
jgi:hypothetical protein